MSNTSELPFPSGGRPPEPGDRRSRDQGPADLPPEQRPVEQPVGGHSSPHGRPRSWILVGVVTAAFCAGGAAIIAHLWPLFWVCAGVVVLSVPVGKLIGIMDDTVEVQGQADQADAGGSHRGAVRTPRRLPRRGRGNHGPCPESQRPESRCPESQRPERTPGRRVRQPAGPCAAGRSGGWPGGPR
ncbi:MAG: hypothetical protein J2P26_06960 [Nocardiopsaceae bacterium]|nr:hypothetical protein [Nocardiopsaceae bacterium]